MSSAPSEFSTPPPRIGMELFLGFVWGGFVVATLFVIFRAWARWHTFKRYFLDDAFVLLALVMFFISAVLWQYSAKYMYQDLYIASGLSSTIPTNFISDSEKYLRAQIGIIFLFMSGLWSVKIAFLLFFRRLGENVSGQRVHWWGAFAFTIATYLVTIGTIEYNCLAPPFLTVVMTCSGESAKHFEHVTLATNLAFDISTDLLILSIPIRMLWKVRIHMRQKLALGAIFSLVMITIAVAIIRFVVVSRNAQPEQSWLYFWNTIETTIAITIACLASFRALFTKTEKHSKIQESTNNRNHWFGAKSTRFGGARLGNLPFWSGSWRSKGRSTIDNKQSLITKHPAGSLTESKPSQEQFIIPGQIHVRNDVEMRSWSRQDMA